MGKCVFLIYEYNYIFIFSYVVYTHMHAYVYFSVAGNQAMDRKKKK